MLKRFKRKRDEATDDTSKAVLKLELSEIQEISDRLFERIDAKIRSLKAIEKQIDNRIELLEKLLARAEKLNVPAVDPSNSRHREVHALADKGLKIDEIAGILDMPKGEVELILSLGRQGP